MAGQGGLGWLARLHVLRDHPDARREVAQALEISRRMQDHQSLVPALFTAIEFHRRKGEVEEAMDLVAEFEKTTEGRAFFRALGLGEICSFLAEIEEWDLLERLLGGLEGGRSEDDPRLARGWLARGRGDLTGAAENFRAEIEHHVASGSPWRRAIALTALAGVRIDQDDRDEASRFLDEAAGLLAVTGPSVFDYDIAEQRIRLGSA